MIDLRSVSALKDVIGDSMQQCIALLQLLRAVPQADGVSPPAEQVCEECGATCDGGADALRRHKLAEHRSTGTAPEARLACKVCAKVYAYPSQLRDHAARHNGDRPYICGECGVDFMKVRSWRNNETIDGVSLE